MIYEKYANRYLVGKDIVEFDNIAPEAEVQGITACAKQDRRFANASSTGLRHVLDADINRTYL